MKSVRESWPPNEADRTFGHVDRVDLLACRIVDVDLTCGDVDVPRESTATLHPRMRTPSYQSEHRRDRPLPTHVV